MFTLPVRVLRAGHERIRYVSFAHKGSQRWKERVKGGESIVLGVGAS